jgi:hypothetical protein
VLVFIFCKNVFAALRAENYYFLEAKESNQRKIQVRRIGFRARPPHEYAGLFTLSRFAAIFSGNGPQD